VTQTAVQIRGKRNRNVQKSAMGQDGNRAEGIQVDSLGSMQKKDEQIAQLMAERDVLNREVGRLECVETTAQLCNFGCRYGKLADQSECSDCTRGACASDRRMLDMWYGRTFLQELPYEVAILSATSGQIQYGFSMFGSEEVGKGPAEWGDVSPCTCRGSRT
jgi:hypothetical protein